MTKTRAPLSIEQALQRVAGQLPGGVEEMAQIVSRQPSTVREWMDPDRDPQISFPAAIALDRAFRAAGGAGWPLFEVYAVQRDLAEAGRFAERHQIFACAQIVLKETGEANAALFALLRPDSGPAARREAAREVAEAFEAYRHLLPHVIEQQSQPP